MPRFDAIRAWKFNAHFDTGWRRSQLGATVRASTVRDVAGSNRFRQRRVRLPDLLGD